METLRDLDLVRAVPARTLLRAADGDGMPFLDVRFSPFGQWYEISSWWEGDFMERTVRGAFSKTMKEQRDNIKILYDHGHDPSLGNKVLAAVEELAEDADTARGGGYLLDTSYNRDLLPGLEKGVYGSSFRFRVIRDEWNDEPGVSEHNPKGLPERTITEVRLMEFGPVTFPASPTATAGVRSLTDAYHERARALEPHRYTDLVARHKAIRTPDAPAAAPEGTAERTGAASNTDDEPATATRAASASDVARRIRVGRVLRGI